MSHVTNHGKYYEAGEEARQTVSQARYERVPEMATEIYRS